MIRLETERLVIREALPEDAGLLAEYALANRDFHRSSSPVREPSWFSESRQREILEADGTTCRRFLLFGKESDPENERVIGSISFSQVALGAFRSCYLGYGMDQRHAGRGLMTEALTACISYIFRDMGLHRIQANVMPANTASIKLLERLGFRREGFHEKYLKINGRWEDHISYAVLNPED